VHPKTNNGAVPLLFLKEFPNWFAGVAFAAIGIGALVPAAIMSIAAANLFTRNIYREYIKKDCTPQHESSVAKFVSLVVKVGALLFVVAMPGEFAINLQLLGGIWIMQTLPTIIIGLYTRWLHRWALLIGWAVGMLTGTWMEASLHFQGSTYTITWLGNLSGYAAVWALVVNLVVTVVLSAVFNAMGVAKGTDATRPVDYNDSTVGVQA
jgi:solute:Na+ symporter, SSS family